MTENPAVIIRKFRKNDREDLRRICYSTGFLGNPVSAFLDGDEIFADAITLYFTDYEPGSCFVAESQGKVIGYIIGAKDARRVCRPGILLRIFAKIILSAALLKPKNAIFIRNFLVSLFKGEFSEPDFSREYPATLHISIQGGQRGANIGARLVDAYLGYLKEEGVRGVHFATMSERASNFFSKQGFKLLYKGKRSYFNYILHKDLPLYIYGKRLAE
jgi:GNAT superfamily N-acetyltransferase